MKDPRFALLDQVGVESSVVTAMVAAVAEGTDEELTRMNLVEFSARRGLPLTKTLDGFLHAAKVGLFDMAWNVCCPGCGGILDRSANLKSFIKSEYPCSLCSAAYEPTLDELIEVVFSVSPSVRKVKGHDPDSLPFWDYFRQMYVSSTLVLPSPDEWHDFVRGFSVEEEILMPNERVVLSLHLAPEFFIVFEPVTHSATFLDVQGEPTSERRDLTLTFTRGGAGHAKHVLRPGPVRLTFENKSDRRLLPGVFRANHELHEMFKRRRRFLTAKDVLTNQTFRDLFKAEALEVDQRLKLASLTVLFTDLKGSTELYERVGDLVAYDMVQKHFGVLASVIHEHDGAVVKTIGDAVMATFPRPELGLSAALAMHSAMDQFNAGLKREDLVVKIGLHEGPCLAVTLNERLDYFGQTVNIASRVQDLADARTICTTESVVRNEHAHRMLEDSRLTPVPRRASLKGLSAEVLVYDIRVE